MPMAFTLAGAERSLLLREARESIASALEQREPSYAVQAESPNLAAACGAFVSLHTGHSLRGCIGRMSSPLPLRHTVRGMARAAAFEDPRFPPLKAEELPSVSIEISVLSPMELCPHLEDIVVGEHGIYLSYLSHSAVFLPQVPVEQGWKRERYLDELCIKAGLYPQAYRERGAQIYTFTALVFSEQETERTEA